MVRNGTARRYGEHGAQGGDEVVDGPGDRERIADRQRRREVDPLPEQNAFAHEDDDVGVDPLRIRARA
jgi:hypothetical protein